MAKQTKAAIKRATIRAMKELGTYKKEFDPIIEIYAELREQYAALSERFAAQGYPFEVPTADGGSKKAPIVATLESLRKDILAYADRLCLNPKSLETVTVESQQKSTLANVLSSLSE